MRLNFTSGAVSADGTRLYNGDHVCSVDLATTTLTRIHAGSGSNSCFLVDDVLYSAYSSSAWKLGAYSLTAPDDPTPITSQSPTPTNHARAIVVTSDGGLVVTAGFSGLKVWAFDGAAFSPAVGAGSTEYLDGVGAWPGNTNGVQTMFRSLTANAAGNRLAAAHFTHTAAAATSADSRPLA